MDELIKRWDYYLTNTGRTRTQKGVSQVDYSVADSQKEDFYIGENDLADYIVSTNKIKDLAITNAKIANAAVDNAKIANVSADKILTSTLTATVDVGSGVGGGYVKLDGENNRITIHDGTTPRIVIGRV